jgi:hypothetical protein
LSREPAIDSKEAQPLYDQYEKPDDQAAEHTEVDGGASAISAAVDAGQTTLDRAYNIRKAKRLVRTRRLPTTKKKVSWI